MSQYKHVRYESRLRSTDKKAGLLPGFSDRSLVPSPDGEVWSRAAASDEALDAQKSIPDYRMVEMLNHGILEGFVSIEEAVCLVQSFNAECGEQAIRLLVDIPNPGQPIVLESESQPLPELQTA